jgi:hypothetical protein
MANVLYDLGREGFLAGEIDWDTAVIKVALCRLTAGGTLTVNQAHKFVSDLVGTATIAATSAALASKTVTTGIADAADQSPMFSAVASNANGHVLVVFQSSAVTGGADVAQSAQRLIAFIDTGTNLPVTPNGGDINVAWDNATNKIFKL